VNNEYQMKLRTAAEAVSLVKSGDWVDYGLSLAQPILLDRALAKRKNELKNVKIRCGLCLSPREVVIADPDQEAFTLSSWHFGGYERSLQEKGLCYFIPMIFRNKPYFYRNELSVDVAMLSVAPMNKHGFFNFSLTNSASMAILSKAKTVILEVNANLPTALGGSEECIHLSEVDYIVEGENSALPVMPETVSDEIDRRIASSIVEEISDGAVIQLGIGAMPNAVGTMIADSDVKDLGMHTEMLVDAYLAMYEKGKLSNRRKIVDKGKGAWTFCVGSKKLYEWVDNNPFLASYPVSYTNDPAVIASHDNFISVNNCVGVDLYGQISAESSGLRQISGSGGQLDFVTGAYMSKGGKSFICFRSTYVDKKTGLAKSRVSPMLSPGEIVTDPRTQAHFLVTEWGKVNVAGKSSWERAEMIISIAHPAFRDELIKEAELMKIWRRSNKII